MCFYSLCGVGSVVHEEKLEVASVVDEESLVAGWHHVAGLPVATVADLCWWCPSAFYVHVSKHTMLFSIPMSNFPPQIQYLLKPHLHAPLA